MEFLARESVFKVYTEYAGGNIQANDAINKVVKKVSKLGFSICQPLLLHVMLDYSNNVITDNGSANFDSMFFDLRISLF